MAPQSQFLSASATAPARSSSRLILRRVAPAAIALAIVTLFLAANLAAYKGYFQDDDLDTLSWATRSRLSSFLYWLVTPLFQQWNFRPVGVFYYRILRDLFGLDYRPYVAVLHSIHLLNAAILYLLLRRLDLPRFAAAAGVLFYAFHAATIDAYWKPMYIYDVACGTLCLLALLLYVRGNWILSLIAFWLAYKAKELAVMLPAVLLAYEFLLGSRRWKRLLPFFAVSLNFGLQGILFNPNSDNDYTIRFTAPAFANCAVFYASSVLLAPYLGFALLMIPFFVRDRRVYFGVLTSILLLGPLLFLPGRLFSVYWYVPLMGVALVAAVLASKAPRIAVAAFFLVWMPLNYAILRQRRGPMLDIAYENREYVDALRAVAQQHPAIGAIVYRALPHGMHPWGAEGAIHIVFGSDIPAYWYGTPESQHAAETPPVATMDWNPATRTIETAVREK